MLRPLLLALTLFAPVLGCAETSSPVGDAGSDAGVVCSCPCTQVVVAAGTTCWEVSCVPYCGPGSGNAC